jgi:O-glycosyl hydrolase
MTGLLNKFNSGLGSAIISFCMILILHGCAKSQPPKQSAKVSIRYDMNAENQTIRNFSASDAWACQFVGNWPEAKKNAIADWLFSMDTLSNGSPKGIGLSMWRYNIGAGTAAQGDGSGIKDEWRRAASFDNTDANSVKLIEGQNWFLQAARKRGVSQFLGFFNSPPVNLTVNGKGYANNGQCNIADDKLTPFAQYAINAINRVKTSTGINLDFISPVNEPQWDWSDGGQEGCPYTNDQIRGIVKALNAEFEKNSISSKILLTEAGQLNYLLEANDKPEKDNQISDFFDPVSSNYLGNLSAVSRTIASHSYFTTSPMNKGIELRNKVRERLNQVQHLEFWQSEYCILGDNGGEISGNNRDLGMDAALYVAKVIYQDMVAANAAAWQWWLAISPYNYKDGLVYVDKNNSDGNYYDSKMLWALGNYSRFIRPGSRRIDIGQVNDPALLVSAYKNEKSDGVVLVVINSSADAKPLDLSGNALIGDKSIVTFTTDNTSNLAKNSVSVQNIAIPARSIVTLVIGKN